MSDNNAIDIRFQIEEIIKLGSPISLDNRYLIDLNLSNLDLSGSNFEGSYFIRVNMKNAILNDCNFNYICS